jgi:hypothetical protein
MAKLRVVEEIVGFRAEHRISILRQETGATYGTYNCNPRSLAAAVDRDIMKR